MSGDCPKGRPVGTHHVERIMPHEKWLGVSVIVGLTRFGCGDKHVISFSDGVGDSGGSDASFDASARSDSPSDARPKDDACDTENDPRNCGTCGRVCKNQSLVNCPDGICCENGRCTGAFGGCILQTDGFKTCADYCPTIGETCAQGGCLGGHVTWMGWQPQDLSYCENLNGAVALEPQRPMRSPDRVGIRRKHRHRGRSMLLLGHSLGQTPNDGETITSRSRLHAIRSNTATSLAPPAKDTLPQRSSGHSPKDQQEPVQHNVTHDGGCTGRNLGKRTSWLADYRPVNAKDDR